MGGRESMAFGPLGRLEPTPLVQLHQVLFSTYMLGSGDLLVTGTHCGLSALSPVRLGSGWLLVQATTLFFSFFSI